MARRPKRNDLYRFPLRRCCACRTRARLQDWSPPPPELHDRCYACEHQPCECCVDFWARRYESDAAIAVFEEIQEEKKAMEKERNKMAPWVTEVIEQHSKRAEREERWEE
jgi:hypothetical protein